MEKEKIKNLLKDYDQQDVDKFASYCLKLVLEKDRNKDIKNPWMQNKTEEQMAELFKRVASDGLIFDGKHITLQKTGVNYDYIAYKNKMYLAYPESSIDISLVYNSDEFNFSKNTGKVEYEHVIKEPFNQNDANIIGGYCVIKNKRGEFLTILSKERIELHRKIAKTDSVWKAWFPEMCMKTIIKKACKTHFGDIYRGIEEMDNDNYDLEKSISEPKPGVTAKKQQVKELSIDDLHTQFMKIYDQYQEKFGEEKASPFHPDNWRTEKTIKTYSYAIKSLKGLLDGNN